MDDINDDILKKLASQVDHATTTATSNFLIQKPESPSIFSYVKEIKISAVCFVCVPIFIFCFLWYWKPMFVMNKVHVDEYLTDYELSKLKLLYSTIIISLVIFIIYFSYSYKKK